MNIKLWAILASAAVALTAAACGSVTNATVPGGATSASAVGDAAQNSLLRRLDDSTTIGSTIDATGDQNPYGLAVAPRTAGSLSAGDLVVCDFNDPANAQGTGSDIIALHPVPGATPLHVVQDHSLLGCTEIAMAPNGNIWAAAFAAKDNPVISPFGAVLNTQAGGPWNHPFGEAFAAHRGSGRASSFYVSDAGNGNVVRVSVKPSAAYTYETIATGFAINHGVPGSILGPSGLQYDEMSDTLFIVDGADNSLVSFARVSNIPAGGITVNGTGFSGPNAKQAHLLYKGAPLNGPISSALLPGGHIVLGNTLDPDGKNLMIEIGPNGRLLDVKNVDTGPAGAIFGMAATGRSLRDLKLYFNDDNDNTVKVLTP